jgi:hypothetical protein
MRKTGVTLSKIAGFIGRAWLWAITVFVWSAVTVAAILITRNGSGESLADVMIAIVYTWAALGWGGVCVWAYRREPMRKMASELREGQEKIRQGQETIISNLPAPPPDAPVFTLHTGGKAHT